jgi:phosphoribosyl 1,2-cyclic phosphodiesterase
MQITSLASSSRGNCYLIQDGISSLLLECGIQPKKIRQHIKLSDLDGCLISHEHQDHSKYVNEIIEYAPIYASEGTLTEIKWQTPIYPWRMFPMTAGDAYTIGSFLVVPFETQHDAKEPLGFLIYSTETEEKLLFATDTYYIKNRFKGLNYIMVECNYASDILKANIDSGKIPKAVAKRLFESHFELENVKKFLQAQDLTTVKAIYLLHMSDGNSDSARFKKEIQELTGVPTYICDA